MSWNSHRKSELIRMVCGVTDAARICMDHGADIDAFDGAVERLMARVRFVRERAVAAGSASGVDGRPAAAQSPPPAIEGSEI